MGEALPHEAPSVDHADGARPARLVPPQFREASLRTLVYHRRGCDVADIAEIADRASQVVIVSQLVVQKFEASDLVQDVAPECDRRSKARLGHVQSQTHDHVGQELVVYAHGGEFRPCTGARLARVKAGHEADPRMMQAFNDVVQVVAANADVAVRQHDDLVGDRTRHVDEVRDLPVLAIDAAVDNQADVEVRIGALQIADDRDRDIGGVVDTKQELDRTRVVLLAEAGQVLAQTGFRPVQRLKYGDRRRNGRPRSPTGPPYVSKGRLSGYQSEDRPGQGDGDEARTKERDHLKLLPFPSFRPRGNRW